MSLIIDSSGWIEFFTDGPKANRYQKYLYETEPIITPSLILYEVYKKVMRERSANEAIFAVTQIQTLSEDVISLDEVLALYAADLSLQLKLAMADAIIYATTLHQEATLITSDHHFKGLKQVELV